MSQKELLKEIRKMGFTPFVCDKGMVHVSAECGDDAADYYGEFRGGYPWINPKLEELARKFDIYWEWDNPGSIVLID